MQENWKVNIRHKEGNRCRIYWHCASFWQCETSRGRACLSWEPLYTSFNLALPTCVRYPSSFTLEWLPPTNLTQQPKLGTIAPLLHPVAHPTDPAAPTLTSSLPILPKVRAHSTQQHSAHLTQHLYQLKLMTSSIWPQPQNWENVPSHWTQQAPFWNSFLGHLTQQPLNLSWWSAHLIQRLHPKWTLGPALRANRRWFWHQTC